MDRKDFVRDPKGSMLALFGVSEDELALVVRDVLSGADDGELYCERTFSRTVSYEGGKVETLSYSEGGGIGLRRVVGEAQYYASGNEFSLSAIRDFGLRLKDAAVSGDVQTYAPDTSTLSCYQAADTFSYTVEETIKFLQGLDVQVRALEFKEHPEAKVEDAELTLSGVFEVILIVRADGFVACDVRPMSMLHVALRCANGMWREWGGSRTSGRVSLDKLLTPDRVDKTIEVAAKIACDLLNAKPCPSGNMPIVVGNGWGGVLVHEAIGHALEGDTIYEKDSVFVGKIGSKVASSLVTIVDDGTISELRGSLQIDDEGTPTERSVLIENGVLKAFMNHRLSARLLSLPATGNGRRESYRCPPIVRMRNTFVENGTDDPEQIIADTEYGLYVKDFSGGQVDPRTGKFTFTADLAYIIKDGKIAYPVRGAALIGDCREALLHIDRVGNDLDFGSGSCGKNGQSVPACVGQPTLRLSGGVTVGGTV